MQSKTTAKDFFLYLGVIIGLYVSAISFLMLIFTIIDKVLPLANEYTAGFDSTIRSTLAALIIFFPAYLYVSHIVNSELKANPERKDVWVRRWGIFLTLFVAGLTILIDLVTLIYRFLGAEDLTARFFLKVFFVLAVAVTVFRSTLYDLKRESFEYTKIMRLRAICVSTIVLIAIIYGVVLIGSPAQQRARILDDQRVNDLVSIQGEIVNMQWQNKGTVPATLDALKNPLGYFNLPTDPETNKSYGYKMLSKNSFELCADFTTVNKTMDTGMTKPRNTGEAISENWQHEATTTCFTRTIDPTLYRVTPTPVQ